MSEDMDQLRARLQEIEEDLTFLRGELGPRSDSPQDTGDAASEMEAIEEQSAQIESLEGERDRIKARLAQG